MSLIRLTFFGVPVIEKDGQPVHMDTRKATALLAFLAVNGSFLNRDKLAGILWSEYEPAGAKAALRRTLSTIRKCLGDDVLATNGDLVGLSAAANLWSDVEELRKIQRELGEHAHPGNLCADCYPLYENGANLYRGDFLSGFSLKDSPEFEDWAFFQAEIYRKDFSQLFQALVLSLEDQGQYIEALQYARKWLSLDILNEEVHRRIMILYALVGQRSAALRQYQDCLRILERELGVRPLEETTRLFEKISRNEISAKQRGEPDTILPPERRFVEAGEHRAASPLFGREEEWEFLLQKYEMQGEAGQFVVLEGEAGIGKTRLAQEFCSYLRNKEVWIGSARSYEGEVNFAYGPFVTVLRSISSQSGFSELFATFPSHYRIDLIRLVPELPGQHELQDLPPSMDPGNQKRLFEAMRYVLLAGTPDQHKPVLFLDDIHLADESTLDLLAYLVRRLDQTPVMILVTWRSDLVYEGHRLRKLLAAVERDGTGSLLKINRLSFTESSQIVSALLTGHFSDLSNITDRIYREAEGVPFFLVEYTKLLLAGPEDIATDELPMPGNVRGLLETRITGSGEVEQQFLQAAAVIGRSFDFETLRSVSGRSEIETINALERLIQLDLIQEQTTQPGESRLIYDFQHDKLRALAYEQTSLARRRLLHRRTAEAIIAQSTGQHDRGSRSAQIGYHFRAAGLVDLAAQYFFSAGEFARSVFANSEAVDYYLQSLATGYKDAEKVHEALGDLFTMQADYSSAIEQYRLALPEVNESDRVRIHQKTGNVYQRRSEWGSAFEEYQSALQELDPERVSIASRIYSDWSLAALLAGNLDEASSLAGTALELAQEPGAEPYALAQAYNVAGILYRHKEDLQKAIEFFRNCLEIEEKLDHHSGKAAVLNNLALVSEEMGDLDEAVEYVQEGLRLCRKIGDRHREAALLNHLADIHHAQGKTELAMDVLKQAVKIFTEIGMEAGEYEPDIWMLVEW